MSRGSVLPQEIAPLDITVELEAHLDNRSIKLMDRVVVQDSTASPGPPTSHPAPLVPIMKMRDLIQFWHAHLVHPAMLVKAMLWINRVVPVNRDITAVVDQFRRLKTSVQWVSRVLGRPLPP